MAAAKLFHSAGQQVTVPTYLVPATQKVPINPYINLPDPPEQHLLCWARLSEH